MEIVIVIIFVGSAVSGASYFVMKYTLLTPVNGEVEHLDKIEAVIKSLSQIQ